MSDQRFVTAPRSRYSPAQIRLRLALYLDGLGREAEAIPVYEEALSLGLKGMDLRDAFVCLASSLRNVGKSHKAVRHLESARMKFPGDAVVNLFLALALYDVKQYKKAIQILGFALLDEIRGSNVERYRKVLRSRYKYLKG
jgi:hypothetical protein